MYAQGLGTAQVFEEAMRWYELSARQGHAKAQFNIAFLYAYGQGVVKTINRTRPTQSATHTRRHTSTR